MGKLIDVFSTSLHYLKMTTVPEIPRPPTPPSPGYLQYQIFEMEEVIETLTATVEKLSEVVDDQKAKMKQLDRSKSATP